MKPSLSLKTLFRSPVRTILTFILLAVVSFAFFMRVSEYAVIRREFDAAAQQYRGVGAVEVEPPNITPEFENFPIGNDILTAHTGPASPHYIETDLRISQDYPADEQEFFQETVRYKPLTAAQVASVSALPYVSFADTRYMTAGVSEEHSRTWDGSPYYPFSSRCIVEATFLEVEHPDPAMLADGERNFASTGITMHNTNKLTLGDCKVLAGNSRYATVFDDFKAFAKFSIPTENVYGLGLQNSIAALYTDNYIYDNEYVNSMVPGQRYIFVLRFNPPSDENNAQMYNLMTEQERANQLTRLQPIFHLGDYLTNDWCDAMWALEGEPENYLETDKFAPLRELIEITNADIHTFDVVYTDDMGSIMRFSESDMAITAGRALTSEDNGAQVCVMGRDAASKNGLIVGDTITLSLGTELFEQYKPLGAVAVTHQRYSPAQTSVTLEIVGLYADTDGPNRQLDKPNWSYSINTIFVPKSLLPVDESTLTNHEFSPAEFSFVIDNAWDIPAFLEEAEPMLAEMGLTLFFNDGGWSDIVDDFKAAQTVSFVNIIVFSAAVLIAIGFTVYLFIGRKKKEYAIMRALGTPTGKSARTLVLPLMTVAAVAILAGSAVGWFYTVRSIASNNALGALQEFAVNTSIPLVAIFGCIFGEILLTLLFVAAMLRRIGKASPLALLQSGAKG